ncbi:hypothetical protein [Bdellovibrio bacteriovorus]|uniref:hypothetical protein n=1 Tax=Bdellovibrio bacteriovorus TaxID=959 RepID=UPI0035A97258
MKRLIILLLSMIFLNSAWAGEEHSEENNSVGPEKGITEFDEHDGFKLSAEAIKNFDLKSLRLKGAGPWEVPNSAILYSGEEINIYRLRDGFYKRIDFVVVSKSASQMKIKSADLKMDDHVVIQGIGFLRTAEIVASGGAPEGHSH